MQNVEIHLKKYKDPPPACPAWTDEVDKSTLQVSVPASVTEACIAGGWEQK